MIYLIKYLQRIILEKIISPFIFCKMSPFFYIAILIPPTDIICFMFAVSPPYGSLLFLSCHSRTRLLLFQFMIIPRINILVNAFYFTAMPSIWYNCNGRNERYTRRLGFQLSLYERKNVFMWKSYYLYV